MMILWAKKCQTLTAVLAMTTCRGHATDAVFTIPIVIVSRRH